MTFFSLIICPDWVYVQKCINGLEDTLVTELPRSYTYTALYTMEMWFIDLVLNKYRDRMT